MKMICKKAFVRGIEVDKKDFDEEILDFDYPFQGKLTLKYHKVGRTLVVSIEVDGHEYF